MVLGGFLPCLSAQGCNRVCSAFCQSKHLIIAIHGYQSLPPNPNMVFRAYAPATKIAAVWMALEGTNQSSIFNTIGFRISWKSFNFWLDLFEKNQCVICNPDTYEAHGVHSTLTNEEINFIIDLVQAKPSLFLI